MDKETALVLLRNFVGKIHKDGHSGVFRCDGLLSKDEIDAFMAAIQALGGDAVFPNLVEDRHAVVQPLPLRLVANEHAEPQGGIRMCLDFGTAMSKAACVRADGTLLDLELGTAVGSTGNTYALESSLFIGRDGVVHFGPAAISASLDEGRDRKRLDSLKQYLSQGALGKLEKREIDDQANSTRVPFTQADAIQLYLAYLTDIACSELERLGESRYTFRTFARPCWDDDRASWAEQELSVLLARAQVLADTLHGKWGSGLKLSELKATLEALYKLEKLPTYLIGNGVPEPVASAASRIQEGAVERGLVIVVDVGAGTTDFAAFWVVIDTADMPPKIWQIAHSVNAVTQAGDTIDGYLQSELLARGHLQPGHPDFSFALTQISLEIRQLKETLFREGAVQTRLSNGTMVEISLQEFLNTTPIRGFEDALKRELELVLTRIDASLLDRVASFRSLGRDEVMLVFSGGGAQLPMVQNLAIGLFDIAGRKLQKVRTATVPAWIRDEYARLTQVYPQLAVAIGGAEKDLPQILDTLAAIVPPGPIHPTYSDSVTYRG